MVSKSINGIEIFNNLSIKGTKRWKLDPPDICPYCSTHESILGIEVVAAYDGILFWECSNCKEKMLRFTKETTIKYLNKTCDLHIDLSSMEELMKMEPN